MGRTTAADKKKMLLKIYHTKKEPFNLKELTKLAKAAGLADAACCDETRRSPRECFLVRPGDKPYVAIDGPSGQPCAANNGAMCDAPRSNFIMVRHMARNASVRRAPCPAARIRRAGDLVATCVEINQCVGCTR